MDFEKNRIIEVINYDKTWKLKYKNEANRLNMLFKSILVSIHHIGSTSIPGMAAKPTIDILIVVSQIEMVDTFNELMAKADYQKVNME